MIKPKVLIVNFTETYFDRVSRSEKTVKLNVVYQHDRQGNIESKVSDIDHILHHNLFYSKPILKAMSLCINQAIEFTDKADKILKNISKDD